MFYEPGKPTRFVPTSRGRVRAHRENALGGPRKRWLTRRSASAAAFDGFEPNFLNAARFVQIFVILHFATFATKSAISGNWHICDSDHFPNSSSGYQ
jgi:hypothetical protein